MKMHLEQRILEKLKITWLRKELTVGWILNNQAKFIYICNTLFPKQPYVKICEIYSIGSLLIKPLYIQSILYLYIIYIVYNILILVYIKYYEINLSSLIHSIVSTSNTIARKQFSRNLWY